VSFTAPASNGGATITGYTVTATPGGATCVPNPGATSCTVTGLVNGTTYTFSVTATNVAGTGAPSVASAPVTPTGPPASPAAPTASPRNARVLVSWQEPSSDGGVAVSGYTVTASPGGATCTTTGALSCFVTGLANGTTYTFTVTASNARGQSLPSPASVAATPTQAPDISVSMVHHGPGFTVGVPATYTVAITNLGDVSTVRPVTVRNRIPAGLSFRSTQVPDGSNWQCGTLTVAAQMFIECEYTGVVGPGQTRSMEMEMGVGIAALPAVVNSVEAFDLDDPATPLDTAGNQAPVWLPTADVTITKSHSGDFLINGDGNRYRYRVANQGRIPTLGTITVVDEFPTGVLPVSFSGTGWACDFHGSTVGCRYTAMLGPGGQTPELSVTLAVSAAAGSEVASVAVVDVAGDGDRSNNTATTRTPVRLIRLGLTKQVDKDVVVIGDLLTYTLRVTNTGNRATTGVVTLVDALPVDLASVSASGTGWTCTVSTSGIRQASCAHPGSLAANAVATVTITGVVAASAQGSISNSAVAEAPFADTTPVAQATSSVFGGGSLSQPAPAPQSLSLPAPGSPSQSGESSQGASDPAVTGDAPVTAGLTAPEDTIGSPGGASDSAPEGTVTRAEAVAYLWELVGSPAVATPCGFTDVPAGAWYEQAVCWARDAGLTAGLGDASRFAPDARVDWAGFVATLQQADPAPGDVPACVLAGSGLQPSLSPHLVAAVCRAALEHLGPVDPFSPTEVVSLAQASFFNRLAGAPALWAPKPPVTATLAGN
jgi:uncharacterized repeat protein (TIGR01451 family)